MLVAKPLNASGNHMRACAVAKVLCAFSAICLLTPACSKNTEKTKAPAVCDVATTDRDALFRRGVALIRPHMQVVDEKATAPNDDEVRVGIACLDRVLETNPSSWPALWIRGKAFQSLGDHDAAVVSFRSAYRLNPDHEDVARETAQELLQTRQFAEAVMVGRDICTRHPNDAGLQANLALDLLMNGEVAEAQKAVATAQKLDPNDAITKALAKRIDEIANGKRPQPKSFEELQRGR
jgi:cytochrome c-type biogenesis protein CcmH/NrfG